MKILLPKNYSYDEGSAYVQDGILYIKALDSFRALMHDITYQVRGSTKCYYCNKPVKRKKNATLDHMIPQDLGGPTIPNNLCVSCPDCNSLKSNMTDQEFLHFLTLSKEERKKYLSFIHNYKDYVKKNYAPVSPNEWITEMSIEKIIVDSFPKPAFNKKFYRRISNFHKKYGRFYKAIVVDKNYNLLDGYYPWLYAQNNSIENVPVIILENVLLLG